MAKTSVCGLQLLVHGTLRYVAWGLKLLVYDAERKLSRQELLVHTCLLLLPKSWHYSVLADTHTHTHALSRARCLSGSLSPSAFLSLTHTLIHTRMLAYARVWWRMVAYDRVVAVWRCEARHGSVSLSDYRLLQYISPPLRSYRFLDITYISYATPISPPSHPISATPIGEIDEAVCVFVLALCMYVCMYVYMYVCMYIYIYI
jgi:hypothetical protein